MTDSQEDSLRRNGSKRPTSWSQWTFSRTYQTWQWFGWWILEDVFSYVCQEVQHTMNNYNHHNTNNHHNSNRYTRDTYFEWDSKCTINSARSRCLLSQLTKAFFATGVDIVVRDKLFYDLWQRTTGSSEWTYDCIRTWATSLLSDYMHTYIRRLRSILEENNEINERVLSILTISTMQQTPPKSII